MPVGSKVVLESPGSSEHNEEEESPDMDMDYLDDYDSDEEKRSHRKRKKVRQWYTVSLTLSQTLTACVEIHVGCVCNMCSILSLSWCKIYTMTRFS